MDGNQLTSFLLAAAGSLAISRIIRLKLISRFPLLLSWLVLSTVEAGLLVFYNHTSAAYFWIYVFLEPLTWLAAVAAGGELFALAFGAYPGIRTVGRVAVYLGMAIGSGVVVVVGAMVHRTNSNISLHLFYLETTDRGMLLSVAFVILTLRVVLSRYPIQLWKNVDISSTFLCFVFLSEASRLLVDSTTPELVNNYVDWTEDCLKAVATVAWCLMLQAAHAETPAVAATPHTAHEEQLIEQLKSVNALLMQIGRGTGGRHGVGD